MGEKRAKQFLVFRKPRNRTIRGLNNNYVMTTLLARALTQTRDRIKSEKGSTLGFDIPVISGDNVEVTRRKSKILSLLEQARSRGLYEQALISSVALTESYLAAMLRLVLTAYPKKLTLNVDGAETERKVDLDLILSSDDVKALLGKIIEKQLASVFYASPETHFRYLEAILAIGIPADAKSAYAEVKATRDILVHNSGIINAIYLKKTGNAARGRDGESIPLDKNYFGDATTTMKKLTQHIYAELLKKYGNAAVRF